MTNFNDSSAGAAATYNLNASETFIATYADTINIASNNADTIQFANPFSTADLTPVINLRYNDTISFAASPGTATNAEITLYANNTLTFSDPGQDTISTNWWGLSPSNNTFTFNGPNDVLYESGADDFIKQGWTSGNTLTGAMAKGGNDTIDGGLNTSINMLFQNYGEANNLFLAPGHTGTTSITIAGGLAPLDGQSWSGYTIENVNPALDQFNIGTATILTDTIIGGSTYIDLSDGVDLLFKDYTAQASALFQGQH